MIKIIWNNIRSNVRTYLSIIGIILAVLAIVIPLKICSSSLPQPKPEWITINLSIYNNIPLRGTYSLEYYTVNQENRLHIRNLMFVGLEPEHDYKLTLNGIPGKTGNEELMMYKRTDGEGYYDFLQIKTDENGNYYSDNFTINNLPSARYNIKFLVKDTDGDKVVLIKDWLDFVIQ